MGWREGINLAMGESKFAGVLEKHVKKLFSCCPLNTPDLSYLLNYRTGRLIAQGIIKES